MIFVAGTSRPPAVLLALGLLAGAGCASRSVPPDPAPEPPPAAADAGLVSAPIVTDVSYVANLFHWVDNLADTSNGRTQPAYYRAWFGRFGPLDEADRAQLAIFRSIRLREFKPRPARPDASDEDCLPSEPASPSRRQMLTAAAMQADSIDDLILRTRIFLAPEEAEQLGSVLRHFAPRFDFLWAEFDWLEAFREQFDGLLAEPVTRRWIASMTRFVGASRAMSIPTVFSFVAVPSGEYGSHAEASEHALLLEIRPKDSIDEQLPVVFHELVHDFERRVPPEERSALAARYLALGYRGAMAFSLLREALPTVLGQGLAQLRLAPAAYRSGLPWYHLPDIDRFAHLLLPTVSRAFDEGRTFAEIRPEEVIGALDETALSSTPPLLFLSEAAFAAPAVLIASLDPLLADVGGRRQWRVATDSTEGASFLSRYTCLPLALLSTAGDPPVPGLESSTGTPPPLTTEAVGALVPLHRSSGAAVLWLYARTPRDVAAVVRAAIELTRWPERSVMVR